MARVALVIVMSSVLALAAACGGEDDSSVAATQPARTAAESATTATTTTQADPNTPAELPSELPPPELRSGLVQTSSEFEPLTVFRIPQGWHGNQDSDGFAIGEGVDLAAEEFDRSSIYVTRIGTGDVPVETAMNRFRKLSGITILSETSATVGGFDGRGYEISVDGEHVLLDPIDERLAGRDIPQGRHHVTLLDVRGQTLMITLDGDTEADRNEAQEVLASFTFPT